MTDRIETGAAQIAESAANHHLSRRTVIAGAAAALLAATGSAIAATGQASPDDLKPKGAKLMNTAQKTDSITTRDGVKIFYKGWGSGQPIVQDRSQSSDYCERAGR